MAKPWRIILGFIGLGSLFLSSHLFLHSANDDRSSAITESKPATIGYKSRKLSHGTAHILSIPAGQFWVTPALSASTEPLENFAKRDRAIAAINGGFFDPENRQSTSFVVLNGQVVADPRQNDRLMQNPNLVPYLDKILNRSEFRSYQCGDTIAYQIRQHQDPIPAGCRSLSALGGGPRLLPDRTDQAEGFVDRTKGRDALGSDQPNARTAIGLTHDSTIIWVMVAQTPNAANSGASLSELAELMKSLGVETAMNLDGGSSSALYYQGKTIYGKLDKIGNPIQRPVKSVFLVKAR
ncbi:MAG: phosphodiester glycosidase family protein [Phormidesmis sp. CAN_BIN44]|nr:phosphodiester glycosidase family protein [Phormidesmis sp. CAN_BIN44]